MSKKVDSFCFIRWCLLLVCSNVFSQTVIKKSDFVFYDFKQGTQAGDIIIVGENILFSSSNQKVYSIDKKEGKINWEIKGIKSGIIPYLYNNTFFYGHFENEVLRTAQFDLNTGQKIKDFPFESIISKPYFLNNIMYATVHFDGGKLIAYNMDENKIVWQKNIGFGVDVKPVYLKDKIIVNAEDNNWFEIGYDGDFLKAKSSTQIYLDTTPVFVKKYKFLTHDGKKITQDFLKKYKLSEDYQVKTNVNHTFILTENRLSVVGNNKKTVLQLDLETEFAKDNFDYEAYKSIMLTESESLWFCYQNQLLYYDFKNKKLLRKVDLTKWNPHQVLLENKTIWLISKNDGKLYGLDFESDQQTADKLQAIANHYKCIEPDPKKIEAAKAAQEKLKNKN